MKSQRIAAIAAILLIGWGTHAWAQGMASGPDPSLALARFFGKDLAFSATAFTTIKSTAGQETTMEMNYAVSDGAIRTDMDMTKLKTAGSDPNGMSSLKQMGLDRSVCIFFVQKNQGYLIYPGLRSYCDISAMFGQTGGKETEPKIDRTELGKETIEGHPCVKSKVTITADDGKKTIATVWEATDLKNIPIQTQTETPDGSLATMILKNINDSKPDAGLFKLPTDYKRYNNVQEMMMSSMQRMMGGIGR